MTTENKIDQHLHRASSTPAVLAGMQPAFMHKQTGESHLAQNDQGQPAHVYSFNGLPEEWIVERDVNGYPLALHPDVVPGYWRGARFIGLSQLSQMPLDS
ncbi:MAG: hypothetical protein AB8B79_08875 [Granulosicoccus sp.]